MGTKKDLAESIEQELPETPQLLRIIASNEVHGFDSIENTNSPMIDQTPVTEEMELKGHNRVQSVSISMPQTPLNSTKRVYFDMLPDSSNGASGEHPKPAKFFSQPIQVRPLFEQANGSASTCQSQNIRRTVDRRFDSFKTWSGKLERQITHLRGKATMEAGPDDIVLHNSDVENLPVDRYYDALEGPELETLRASEEILLPDDERWPFLLRFPISSFGICLGVGSQAIMWKTLAISASTKFLNLSLLINLAFWSAAVALVIIVSTIYLLKLLFYFEAVRREYYHPIRVNFFFAPWIALLFLALGVPPSLSSALHHALWYVLMAPILCLELKIYGQWMSGGQRRLSRVANPSNHLSIVGNFVGALLGASMGLKEGPIFFFAIGLAHYTVLFVTLYQRLPTNETLPKELHPVFFLFVAAPSVASMAWATLQGSFDYGSRIAYFIALFLYFSLAVRINFFIGFKFSLAWWAYTFPMTGAAVATIKYANQVTNIATQVLAVTLSFTSTLIVSALLVTTILHAFVYRDLFPNDLAIAISDRKPKHHTNGNRWFHRRHLSSDNSNIESYLKFTQNDDLEANTTNNNNDDNDNDNDNDKDNSVPDDKNAEAY